MLQDTGPGYLKSKDDGPDQPEGQTVVSIHNVMGAHVFQVHFLLLQELQRFVHILQAVDPHAALCGLWLLRDKGHEGMGLWASFSFPPTVPGPCFIRLPPDLPQEHKDSPRAGPELMEPKPRLQMRLRPD